MRDGASRTRPARRLSPPTGAVVAALLALLALSSALPSPVRAERRSVASFHFVLDAVGFDLERESAGRSWLVGASLAPVGLYGGLRHYASTAASDRAFWTVYGGLLVESAPLRLETIEPGMWAALGYEIRLDPRVRGTGEVGFGLRAYRGELWPGVFIGLSLGWKLPQ